MEGRCKCRKGTEEKRQKRAGLKSSQHFQDISKHLFLRQFFTLVQYVLHVLLAQTCFNVDDSKENMPKTIPGLIRSQLPLSTLLTWFMLKNMMGDIWDVYCEWSLAYPHSWTAKGRARPLHPTPEAESMLTRREDKTAEVQSHKCLLVLFNWQVQTLPQDDGREEGKIQIQREMQED